MSSIRTLNTRSHKDIVVSEMDLLIVKLSNKYKRCTWGSEIKPCISWYVLKILGCDFFLSI